jgi:hypothetical protein
MAYYPHLSRELSTLSCPCYPSNSPPKHSILNRLHAENNDADLRVLRGMIRTINRHWVDGKSRIYHALSSEADVVNYSRS